MSISSIQQTTNAPLIRALNIGPELTTSSGGKEPCNASIELHDIHSPLLATRADTGKPLLTPPSQPLNDEFIVAQLQTLAKGGINEQVSILPANSPTQPSSEMMQAINNAVAEENCPQLDTEDQFHMAEIAQVMFVHCQKMNHPLQSTTLEFEHKLESPNVAKQSDFVGIQTNETMSFLLNVIRKALAEMNVAERRITTMFAELHANMTEKAAASTIKEGIEIYNGALMGFAASVTIAGAGAAFQGRVLSKQSQVVKNHLEPAREFKEGAQEVASTINNLGAPIKNEGVFNGLNGEQLTPTNVPNLPQQQRAEVRISESAQKLENRGEGHAFKYEQKTNKYRTQGVIVDQITRNSDGAGQLATASNQSTVKEAEANKMIQNTAGDIAHSVGNDKQKNIEQTYDMAKQMIDTIIAMGDSTLRTNQSIVRG